MPLLRIGVYRLPQAEAGLIRALLTLLSADSVSPKWAYVESGPYDAVVVDSEVAGDADVRTLAQAILKVAPANALEEQDTMPRPIRADRLSRWLKDAERALGRPASLAAPTESVTVTEPGGTRYRLRKWPPVEAVRNDPMRVRMATVLSRRGLTISELADMGRVPKEKCTAFVQTLRSLGLLTIEQVGSGDRAESAVIADEIAQRLRASASVAPSDARRSLVNSLRRRLGI